MPKSKYFIDTEFIDDGEFIDLISIGLVSEDGREYYAQSVEFNHRRASDWVKENVLKQLLMCPHAEPAQMGIPGLYRSDKAYHKHQKDGQCAFPDCPWRTRGQIKQDILSFMDIEKYGNPELWGYYSAYDHVVFAQLFGAMIDLPSGYPMYTRDIKQWMDQLDFAESELPEQTSTEHNALEDARYNKVMHDFLSVAEWSSRT